MKKDSAWSGEVLAPVWGKGEAPKGVLAGLVASRAVILSWAAHLTLTSQWKDEMSGGPASGAPAPAKCLVPSTYTVLECRVNPLA